MKQSSISLNHSGNLYAKSNYTAMTLMISGNIDSQAVPIRKADILNITKAYKLLTRVPVYASILRLL